jgi:hypothetical protein
VIQSPSDVICQQQQHLSMSDDCDATTTKLMTVRGAENLGRLRAHHSVHRRPACCPARALPVCGRCEHSALSSPPIRAPGRPGNRCPGTSLPGRAHPCYLLGKNHRMKTTPAFWPLSTAWWRNSMSSAFKHWHMPSMVDLTKFWEQHVNTCTGRWHRQLTQIAQLT